VVAVVVLSVVVGGALGYVLTRGDADHGGTVASTAATAAPTTAAATTAAPTSTAPPATNALGPTIGMLADAASARPEERFAAGLANGAAPATPASAAALYAAWWKLFIGQRAPAVASADGFAITDGSGQTLDLSGYVLGADGNVADLVECASTPGSAPTCNRLSDVITPDPTAPVVGQTAGVTLQHLGEMRLLRARVVHFLSMAAAKPVTAATSAGTDVRFDDHVLAVAVGSDAVPPTVDVALTYADGSTETVSITV